jgi:hypothetical protein
LKKLLVVMGVLILGAMVCGTANATLLGIKAAYEGNAPDIEFDNGGILNYYEGTDLFSLVAYDKTFIAPDGTTYVLIGTGLSTRLTLQCYVDVNGNLTGGVEGYDMIEEVIAGSVTIDGVTYGPGQSGGTVLLQADVDQFGWRYNGGGFTPSFDFLFDTASGGLVTQGLWPSPSPGTALWFETAATDYSWDADFELIRAKGDKMVTPEPSSMLLLGMGLFGFVGRAARMLEPVSMLMWREHKVSVCFVLFHRTYIYFINT